MTSGGVSCGNVSDDRLPLCRYGVNCYRRNPIHFEQFRHPEDHVIAKEMKSGDQPKSHEDTDQEQPEGTSKPDDGDGPLQKKPRLGGFVADTASFSISKNEGDEGFNIFLTTVRGLESKWNDPAIAKSIQDILSMDANDFVSSVQFNYMFDPAWLISNYPEANRRRPLLIVVHPKDFHAISAYAEHSNETERTMITVAQARLPIAYGTHHTKMMILKYRSGIRIVVHTANMIPEDWDQKTQGMYITPLFRKLPDEASAQREECEFKTTLIEYLNAYKLPPLEAVARELAQYDMSCINVQLIASTPGRFQGMEMEKWGHGKLRAVLKKHVSGNAVGIDWPVVAQFSSIGSLGAGEDQWLMKEFKASLAAAPGQEAAKASLSLVFPTVENVRTSLEGYAAGGSLPYQNANAVKQGYLKRYLHQWRSACKGRTRASPHIKTYFRVSPCLKKIAWFLLTSANLSKAAWGAYEKNGTQLMIRSYELGVVFLPQSYGKEYFDVMPNGQVPDTLNQELKFPLPYDLPLVPYSDDDEPWVADRSYKHKRDSRGRFWR